MKILVLGHGRHGKDTVAAILRDEYVLSFISSSEACAEVLKPVLDLLHGERDHFAERHDHRELWKRLISLYNAADPSALAKHILSKCDMYVGMRSAREYAASRHLFDFILWVDASPRVDYADPTLEIRLHPQLMVRIDNSSHFRHLREEVRQAASFIGL